MASEVKEMNCPGCGARVSIGQQTCEWCNQPVTITTFNSVYSMPMPQVNKYAGAYRKALAEHPDDQGLNSAVGMCFLKLGLYDKALEAFEKAMPDNFDNSETFFYAAVCLLQGKKAFLTPRVIIDKAESYIQSANMIEPKGIYYYFWAYLRYDHHERKGYRVNPNYKQLLAEAQQYGLSQTDVAQLYEILKVQRPACL